VTAYITCPLHRGSRGGRTAAGRGRGRGRQLNVLEAFSQATQARSQAGSEAGGGGGTAVPLGSDDLLGRGWWCFCVMSLPLTAALVVMRSVIMVFNPTWEPLNTLQHVNVIRSLNHGCGSSVSCLAIE
jgi:hypothetical protein